MSVATHDPESTLIASNLSVRQYRTAAKGRECDRIAEAIKLRFTERYLEPARGTPRHGFTTMAIGCLMLEALESFMRGWKKSVGQGEKLFVEFLDREAAFAAFRGRGSEFYRHVRCGILRQAETTGGWRIVRSGSLLTDKTINAMRFIAALETVLATYCQRLTTESWGSKEWNKVCQKMNYICDNCLS